MEQKRRGISLTITLAVSISLLVLIAVIAVLALGLWSGAQNTMTLLRDKARIVVSTMVDKVETHLSPARHQLAFIEKLVATDALDPTDTRGMTDTLKGALAAAPQIAALLYVDTDLNTLIIGRSPEGLRVYKRLDINDRVMRDGVANMQGKIRPVWGPPVWRDLPQETMLNLRRAIYHKKRYAGFLIAAVTIRTLSSYLGRLDPTSGSHAFILYDEAKVIAHPNLTDPAYPRSKDKPLRSIHEVGDPILSKIWQKKNRYPLGIVKGTELQGHVLRVADAEYIFIYRKVAGYGDKPWLIGTYFRSSEVNSELVRLWYAALAGLVVLAIAVAFAIFLARSIASPIVGLASAASRIGQLEISETKELPGSVFRELNDQARAFNAMLQGLRWFEIYVPKTLVRRLLQNGNDRLPPSEERDVTVMFTDIAGFTTLSEGLPAADLAAMLNEHFALLAKIIEAEGGTVDKFIGDSVMAFWGAPDDQPDHAARALRAARAIIAAAKTENARRLANGGQAIKMRVGIHSGRVTVGNIGAPGRINYTIIGDTVNVGQRLEQLAKSFAPGDDTTEYATVLASANTIQRAGLSENGNASSLGHHHLRGREAAVEVFKIA